MFYQLRKIVFVDICDFSEDQIPSITKTRKLHIVPLLFLRTANSVRCYQELHRDPLNVFYNLGLKGRRKEMKNQK